MLRLCNGSHFSASFRRFQHGDFVEVLDVAADRSADGGACDFSPALLSCFHTAVASPPTVGSEEVRFPVG